MTTQGKNPAAITPDLTVTEIASELQIHADTVRRLLLSGAISGYKIGARSWRVRRGDLDAYKEGLMQAGKSHGATEAPEIP